MEDQKVTVEIVDISKCKKRLRINVPLQRTENKFSEIVSTWLPKATVPGFRKGKVPRSIVEQKFSDEIKTEVLRAILPDAYLEAVKESGVQPVAEPVLENINYERGQDLVFDSFIDTFPQIPQVKYRKIKLEKKRAEVTEEEVGEVMKKICEERARFIPEEPREVREGDYVLVDYDVFLQGKKVEEKKAQVLYIDLTNEKTKGFFEQLLGVSCGEMVNITPNFQEGIPEEKDTNTDGVYQVRIIEIKKKEIPKLDDVLLKELGDFTSIDEFKEKMKNDILSYKENLVSMDLKTKLLNKLVELYPFELPESVIKKQTEYNIEETKRRMTSQKVPLKTIQDEAQKISEAAYFDAKKQIHSAYILHGISEHESLLVSDEDVDAEIEKIAKNAGYEKEKLKEQFKKEDRLGSIKERLLEEKTISFILEKVPIKTSKEKI
ncbi:trigger factor [Chlamydiota bacterium]